MKLRFNQLLWRQFNGPQAVALIKAMASFFQGMVQPHLDYFDNLGIGTANDAHLTFFGTVLGLPRPLVWNTDDPYWLRWFRVTEEEVTSDQGFSDPENPLFLGVGGLLSEEYTEYADPERARVEPEKYRKMLEAISTGVGEIGSLALLDVLVSIFFDSDEYTITQPGTLQAGDVLVTLMRDDEIAYTAVYAVTRLWQPDTHVTVNLEV